MSVPVVSRVSDAVLDPAPVNVADVVCPIENDLEGDPYVTEMDLVSSPVIDVESVSRVSVRTCVPVKSWVSEPVVNVATSREGDNVVEPVRSHVIVRRDMVSELVGLTLKVIVAVELSREEDTSNVSEYVRLGELLDEAVAEVSLVSERECSTDSDKLRLGVLLDVGVPGENDKEGVVVELFSGCDGDAETESDAASVSEPRDNDKDSDLL